MNAAQQLDFDLHKIVIGDMLAANPKLNVAVHEPTRSGDTTPYIANEVTLDHVIQTILWHVRDHEFSLDVRCTSGDKAVIRVRIYHPPIEGLI